MGILNDNIRNPHISNTAQGQRGPPGVGFKLTSDGNYDADNKKLTNLAEGENNSDAVTKTYVDNHNTNTNYLKIDGSSTMSGNLNMNNNMITNLKDTTSSSLDSEAVNKK